MNYQKLRGRIVEKYGTQSNFAEAVGLTEQSITAKMNGRTAIRNDEILLWCELLGIRTNEIGQYFFTQKVLKNKS